MDFIKEINDYYDREKATIDKLDWKELNTAMNALLEAYEKGATVYVFGNGGSSATASHMRIVREMYARGFEFLKLDLYRAKATKFQIIDGKIMPALNSIEGLGDTQAVAVEEAAKAGPFLSKDDFRVRTKVSKTIIDALTELDILSDVPESNQISLFDLNT